MKEITKLGLTLLIFCLIAAVALGFANEVTKGPIIENSIRANIEARKEVFPEADEFELIATSEEGVEYEAHKNAKSFFEENPKVKEVYKAISNGEHIGYVIKTAPNGYGGAIVVVIGFRIDGVITGVRVGDHQETPGLGAKAKTEDYYLQYNNLSITKTVDVTKTDVVDGNNEIKAISGATITSVAVTNGVNYSKLVLDAFK